MAIKLTLHIRRIVKLRTESRSKAKLYQNRVNFLRLRTFFELSTKEILQTWLQK